MSLERPRYRKNRLLTIDRKGRKTWDDQTGAPCYERDIVLQNGVRKNSRDKGSYDQEYGPSANVGPSQPPPPGSVP